jgi:hypothetical protein
MNVELIRPGHRQTLGTQDVNRYHWYATKDRRLVRGGVATKGKKLTPHEDVIHVGDIEARYIGVYTRNYVALPGCDLLLRAIGKAWDDARLIARVAALKASEDAMVICDRLEHDATVN